MNQMRYTAARIACRQTLRDWFGLLLLSAALVLAPGRAIPDGEVGNGEDW